MGSKSSKNKPLFPIPKINEKPTNQPFYMSTTYDREILYPDLPGLSNDYQPFEIPQSLVGNLRLSFKQVKKIVKLTGLVGDWIEAADEKRYHFKLSEEFDEQKTESEQNNNNNNNNENQIHEKTEEKNLDEQKTENRENSNEIETKSNEKENIKEEGKEGENIKEEDNIKDKETKRKEEDRMVNKNLPVVGGSTIVFDSKSTDFLAKGPNDFIMKLYNVISESKYKDQVDFYLEKQQDKQFYRPPDLIIPKLYLCGQAQASEKKNLKNLKISHVLAVGNSLPTPHPKLVKYKKIEVYDSPTTLLKKYFKECIDFIEEGRNSGTGVIVHCAAGISRSATITTAYLMYKFNMNFKQAFLSVTARHYCSPNSGFRMQLLEYQKELEEDRKKKTE